VIENAEMTGVFLILRILFWIFDCAKDLNESKCLLDKEIFIHINLRNVYSALLSLIYLLYISLLIENNVSQYSLSLVHNFLKMIKFFNDFFYKIFFSIKIRNFCLFISSRFSHVLFVRGRSSLCHYSVPSITKEFVCNKKRAFSSRLLKPYINVYKHIPSPIRLCSIWQDNPVHCSIVYRRAVVADTCNLEQSLLCWCRVSPRGYKQRHVSVYQYRKGSCKWRIRYNSTCGRRRSHVCQKRSHRELHRNIN